MGNPSACALKVIATFCIMISLTAAQVPSGRPTSSVPHRIPEVLAVLMYDSNLPGIQTADTAVPQDLEPFQESKAELTSESKFDDPNANTSEELADVNVRHMARPFGYSAGAMQDVFIKRGFYHPSRQDLFKRSSLNELIRRLMALRGNSFTDGRASLMRFGAGRRK